MDSAMLGEALGWLTSVKIQMESSERLGKLDQTEKTTLEGIRKFLKKEKSRDQSGPGLNDKF